jgi:hypothetical protein
LAWGPPSPEGWLAIRSSLIKEGAHLRASTSARCATADKSRYGGHPSPAGKLAWLAIRSSPEGRAKDGGPDLSQMEPPAALVRTGWSVQGRRIIRPLNDLRCFTPLLSAVMGPDFQRFEIICQAGCGNLKTLRSATLGVGVQDLRYSRRPCQPPRSTLRRWST